VKSAWIGRAAFVAASAVALPAYGLLQATDDPLDPAVVLTLAQGADGSTVKCTGTVVASRTVLTAAHCVAPSTVGRDARFFVFLGADGRGVEPGDPSTVAVASVDIDPDFDRGALATGHDLAVLRTTAVLVVAPLDVARERIVGGATPARMIGYGVNAIDDEQGGTALVRRQSMLELLEGNPPFLSLRSSAGPCEGDSGAPALIRDGAGGERIVAITSYAPEGCGEGAALSDLTAYGPLIDAWLAADDPASPAAGGCNVTGSSEPGSRGSSMLIAAMAAAAFLRRKSLYTPSEGGRRAPRNRARSAQSVSSPSK
jgi:MYXO-CTERM domain-containing protein